MLEELLEKLHLTTKNAYDYSRKNKSKKKKLKKKFIYKNRVRESVFFMLSLNGSYIISLSCMVLFRDGLIRSETYVKILFAYTCLTVLLGVFYLPYKLKHYGLNRKKLIYNLKMGSLLGLIGLILAVLIRISLVKSGRLEFRFRAIPEWEFFLYPFSVMAQETMIRGYLQSYFISLFDGSKKNEFVAIFLSSIIFGIMHLMYGFILAGLAFLFSIILGYFYRKSESLVGVLIIHFMTGTAMFYFKH
ncbi:MAG: CPBP family intramembrane metalloprotease [Leptospiraceae bacterium]|nr:CPBP family intramembrane metalloprotease [Leptospiraceae bacterium]MCP5499252.1 CPBP family intramembrane metalloprotease [Leptospiraceae bacterium]